MKDSTSAIHIFDEENKKDPNQPIITPLYLTSTYTFGNPNERDYSRSGNPNRSELEAILAKLDNNKYGVTFSSGSAALAAIVDLLKSGDTIAFSTDVYGGTYRFLTKVAAKRNIHLEIYDFSNLLHLKKLATSKANIIWVETPTNPLLKIYDIEKLAEISRTIKSTFVVDNTFATSVIQKPSLLGADIVVISSTKYINGHSYSIGGSITTSNERLYEELSFLQNASGAILSPFDAWLTTRGVRTLDVRVKQQSASAEKIADFLIDNDQVSKVFYPKYADAGQREIVDKQMSLFGAMVSFELKENVDNTEFIEHLKLIPLAESLGGIESLLDHPASMTHASIPKDEREKIGLSDGLYRLSVGIEDVDDLIADLGNAIEASS